MELIKNGAVDARSLHHELGIHKDFSNWIKDKINAYDFKEGIDYTTREADSTGGRPAIEYNLTIDAAQIIASKTKTSNQTEVYKYLIKLKGNVVILKERDTDEIEFGKMLDELFYKVCEFERQYPVLGYRIDFYSEKYKLAVEHDGTYHDIGRVAAEDARRQRQIEDKLGCKFIRVKKGYELKGLNEIFRYVRSKSLTADAAFLKALAGM